MSLEDDIVDLVTATTKLTTAVNKKKIILDNAVNIAIEAKNEAIEARDVAIQNSEKHALSAYEIAVRAGFDGTEEEWLASLHSQVNISTEPNNRLELKHDGLYVSNILDPDPLPFYILSKG